MKVEMKSNTTTVRGHQMLPGKVYVNAENRELVVIMVGRKGTVEENRHGLIVKNSYSTPTSSPVGSLTVIGEKEEWIEAEATLSILI